MKHHIYLRSKRFTLEEAYAVLHGAKSYDSRDEIIDAAQLVLDDERLFMSLHPDLQVLLIMWIENGILMPPENYSLYINDSITINSVKRELEN